MVCGGACRWIRALSGRQTWQGLVKAWETCERLRNTKIRKTSCFTKGIEDEVDHERCEGNIRKHMLQDVPMGPFLPLFWLRHPHGNCQLPKGIKNQTSRLHSPCRFTEEITLRTSSARSRTSQGKAAINAAPSSVDKMKASRERADRPLGSCPVRKVLSQEESGNSTKRGQRRIAQCPKHKEGAIRGQQEERCVHQVKRDCRGEGSSRRPMMSYRSTLWEKEFFSPRTPTIARCQTQRAQSHPVRWVLSNPRTSPLCFCFRYDHEGARTVMKWKAEVSTLHPHCGLPAWGNLRREDSTPSSASWLLQGTGHYHDQSENGPVA